MPESTSTVGLRYPTPTEPNDVPADMQRLAEDVDDLFATNLAEYVTDHGWVADDNTDNASALSAAINAAGSSGTVVVPDLGGVARIASAVDVPAGWSTNLVFQGKRNLRFVTNGQINYSPTMEVTGRTLSAKVAYQATVIPLDDVSGIQVGMYLRLDSDQYWEEDWQDPLGETALITAVDGTNSEVTVATPIAWEYDPGLDTVDVSAHTAISPTVSGMDAILDKHRVLNIEGGEPGTLVEDVVCDGSDGGYDAIQLLWGVGMSVSHATFRGDMRYGVLVSRGTRATYVDDITGYAGVRHSVVPAGNTVDVYASRIRALGGGTIDGHPGQNVNYRDVIELNTSGNCRSLGAKITNYYGWYDGTSPRFYTSQLRVIDRFRHISDNLETTLTNVVFDWPNETDGDVRLARYGSRVSVDRCHMPLSAGGTISVDTDTNNNISDLVITASLLGGYLWQRVTNVKCVAVDWNGPGISDASGVEVIEGNYTESITMIGCSLSDYPYMFSTERAYRGRKFTNCDFVSVGDWSSNPLGTQTPAPIVFTGCDFTDCNIDWAAVNANDRRATGNEFTNTPRLGVSQPTNVEAGVATIPDGSSSVTVSHDRGEPPIVTATEYGDERVWVSERLSGSFTLSRSGTSGALDVGWIAQA